MRLRKEWIPKMIPKIIIGFLRYAVNYNQHHGADAFLKWLTSNKMLWNQMVHLGLDAKKSDDSLEIRWCYKIRWSGIWTSDNLAIALEWHDSHRAVLRFCSVLKFRIWSSARQRRQPTCTRFGILWRIELEWLTERVVSFTKKRFAIGIFNLR